MKKHKVEEEVVNAVICRKVVKNFARVLQRIERLTNNINQSYELLPLVVAPAFGFK
jgi:hypothetical protein